MEKQQTTFKKQINNYVYCVEDSIGKGFSSVVYRGVNVLNQQTLAIKVIDQKSLKTDLEKTLLGNELKALGATNHENVVKCHEICQTANNIYIVTEFCQQGDLSNYIKKHGQIKQENAINILSQVAQGLCHIHSKGFLHRDLKTANILLKAGIPKIADFGFAIQVENAQGRMPYNVGSPLYMSPEAYTKSEYSYKSDVWGLGVIFYEMLLGSQPFKGIDYKTLIKQCETGSFYTSLEISPLSKLLLSKLMSVDITKRPLAHELIQILQSNRPQTVPLPMSPLPSTIPLTHLNENHRPGHLKEIQQLHMRAQNRNTPQKRDMSMASPPKFGRERSNSPASPQSPIALIKSQSKDSLFAPSASRQPICWFTQRLELANVLQTCYIVLNEFCQNPYLAPLCLEHIKYNSKLLYYLSPQDQTVHGIIKRTEQLVTSSSLRCEDPYLKHVIKSIQPQSETFCDYTLFWLKMTIKGILTSLSQGLNQPTQQNWIQPMYYCYLQTVKYCQVLDHINSVESEEGELCPTNDVLDWLIKDCNNITQEGLSYLNAISEVLTSS